MSKNRLRMRSSILIVVASLSLLMFSCDNTSSIKEGSDRNATKEKIERYDNGVIHKVARYVRGKLSGVQELYNTKGELQNTMTYVNGVQDGESIIYFDNGSKYRITPYVNGKIEGERIKYRKDGRLWSTQNYKNGMPENNLKEYAESGKIKSTPKLVVNKVYMKDGSIQANLAVKGNYKRVKYFNGKLKGDKYFNKSLVSILDNQERSKANIVLNSINRSYNIIAQVTTQADNHLFLYKKISL